MIWIWRGPPTRGAWQEWSSDDDVDDVILTETQQIIWNICYIMNLQQKYLLLINWIMGGFESGKTTFAN